VKDITQFQARGLTPQQIEETRQFLSRMGPSQAEVTHPTTTLEDLFIRVVRENTPGELEPIAGNGNGTRPTADVGGRAGG
jgi:hypothetical protein